MPTSAFATSGSLDDPIIITSPLNITMKSGETYNLNLDKHSGIFDSSSVAVSDSSVIECKYGSWFNARKPGTATVTFRNNVSEATVNFTVVLSNDWSIQNYGGDVLDKIQMGTVVNDDRTIQVSDYRDIVMWASSNPEVVKVSHSDYCARCNGSDPRCGRVDLKALSSGKTAITAIDSSGASRSVDVYVDWDDEEAERSWAIEPSIIRIAVGDDYYPRISDGREIKPFESSNPSVASVEWGEEENDWVVYANGIGTANLTATDIYGKTATCLVIVEQSPMVENPSLEKQMFAYSNKCELMIDAMDGDDYEYDAKARYQVWRSKNGGSYKLVKTLKHNTDSLGSLFDYTDKGLKPNTKYNYKVAYSIDGGKSWGPKSKAQTYWTSPKCYASGVKTNSSKVTWKKVKGASGYCVFLRSNKFLGYNIFGNKVYYYQQRTCYTAGKNLTRRYNTNYKEGYEKVQCVVTYAKHGGKYYADGELVRKKKTKIYEDYKEGYRWSNN